MTAVVWLLSADRCSLSKTSRVRHSVNQGNLRHSGTVQNGHFFFFMCLFSDTFKVPASVKWLKLNYKNTGFYIVHYGDGGWDALREALSNNVSVLTQEDRASLIHNIFALSRYSVKHIKFCN